MNNSKTRDELPMTDAEAVASGLTRPIGPGMEIVLDNNFVSIPLSRYNELIQEETIMDTLVSFYITKGTGYEMNNLIEAMFGPREEGTDA